MVAWSAEGHVPAVAEIKVGDEVLAADPETGERGPRTVTAVLVHQDTVLDLLTDDGAKVTTTEDHPFYNATDKQWQQAQDLDPGDQLHTADGEAVRITGLLPKTAHVATAYNLTVHDIHTFHVAIGSPAVLVHNDCDADFEGIQHVLDRHTAGGRNVDPDSGIFEGGVNLQELAHSTAGQIGRRQENGNIEYVVQSRGVVGVEGRTGLPTTTYTVIRNQMVTS